MTKLADKNILSLLSPCPVNLPPLFFAAEANVPSLNWERRAFDWLSWKWKRNAKKRDKQEGQSYPNWGRGRWRGYQQTADCGNDTTWPLLNCGPRSHKKLTLQSGKVQSPNYYSEERPKISVGYATKKRKQPPTPIARWIHICKRTGRRFMAA